MPYPNSMQNSIKQVEATRKYRMDHPFPRLTAEEKAKLLEMYHPDYKPEGKRELRIGPNKGEPVPQELAEVLEGEPFVDPDKVNLDRIDYRTDVLIIGGGGAGASAALMAESQKAKVILATKLRFGDSNTIMAEGGIAAATEPDDSPVLHYLDTMGGGGYKNVPELVEALVLEAPLTVKWLEDLGVMFDRLPSGSILTHAPGGHCRRRSHSCKDLTGLEIMRVLRDEVRNRENIFVLEFSPAIELLTDAEGKCCGALLYNFDTQEYLVVQAKAVILATGGMGRLHMNQFPTSNHYGATADGLVLAYRAGARLIYADAVQYHPTGVAWPEQMLGQLITEAIRANGAHLVNAQGEMFINELETRDTVSSAMIRECTDRKKGVRTPTEMDGVWLDTPMLDLIGGKGKAARQFAGIYRRFKEYNIEIDKEPILMYPTQHYQNGGVKMISGSGESEIPGLYLAGEVAGGVHGRNRLGANSLVDVFVFGRRAGVGAAQYAEKITPYGPGTLEHLRKFKKEFSDRMDVPKLRSPILLPDYINPERKERKYY
ncbi:FAD-binding protein [Candidatus Formimonas warabiya]|uniref:Succinate dehydrogenase/fumarate reductase flavoprotein subunit n=1 Tax=Formimonas warabiya TaxID=1761012 RepID=A0A3G1KR86_FORW1|nr:FAD-binding protein [Candidatus Formimonas warabiya]ATW24974.1 succinate dehydrogenase/fumarate reductase flavoprotein subunit [Candidatus Formimonas warabiya]